MKLVHYFNCFLMIPTALVALSYLYEPDFIGLAAVGLFFIGAFQVLTGLFWLALDYKNRYLQLYWALVITYFVLTQFIIFDYMLAVAPFLAVYYAAIVYLKVKTEETTDLKQSKLPKDNLN